MTMQHEAGAKEKGLPGKETAPNIKNNEGVNTMGSETNSQEVNPSSDNSSENVRLLESYALAVKAANDEGTSPAAAMSDEDFDAHIRKIAGFREFEFERKKASLAESLGLSATALDKLVKLARKEIREEAGKVSMFPVVEPWEEPVDAVALLDEIAATLKRFIVSDSENIIAATLWIAFTWFIDRVDIAPILNITAPDKACGKSQLLALVSRLSCRPLPASNISPAAIYRTIEAHSPTLLIDEVDSFLKENEEARGVLNSGHTRDTAFVIRIVGESANLEPARFSTWGAKCLCGIGKIPDTLASRSIILTMRRKLKHETMERARHAEPELFKRLQRKLCRFSDDAGESIGIMRPELQDDARLRVLSDRSLDNWEPLICIADHAGGRWPDIAREAALKLSGIDQETMSIGVRLLSDIQSIFEQTGNEWLSSSDLLQKLLDEDDSVWLSCNRERPLTKDQMGKRLGDYGIKTEVFKSGGRVVRRYKRIDFEDSFDRYLSRISSTPQNSCNAVTETQLSNNNNDLTRLQAFSTSCNQGGLAVTCNPKIVTGYSFTGKVTGSTKEPVTAKDDIEQHDSEKGYRLQQNQGGEKNAGGRDWM